MSSRTKRRSGSAVALGVLGLVAEVHAQPARFDGASFTCAEYVAAQEVKVPEQSRAELANIWMHGYLAGIYTAAEVFQLSDAPMDADALTGALLASCRELSNASLMAVGLAKLAPSRFKIPRRVTNEVSLDEYTCADHLDAKVERAELAELWAFAFIQGFKNARQPELLIPVENRAPLGAAIRKNCEKNRETKYLELVRMVAEAVKLAVPDDKQK